MTDEQPNPAPAELPQPAAVPPRWSPTEVWTLGVFSVLGLLGFAATFALLMMRAPSSDVARQMSPAELARLKGAPGERGPAGPPGAAGPRGPAGESGVRVVRVDCAAGNCTAECADDEILLSAYCSPGRTAATFPAEHSAACRATGRGRLEVVAAFVKAARR
ncbi:MAG: hypothetical protein NTV56_25385 [Alphaproteobacteria bacterium]|nr:hypothetical protein [Alphaproteobacteria bacterium]